ncbi:MAG: hypothetical protein ACTHU0_32735 [Kofleriaceae bacterium]
MPRRPDPPPQHLRSVASLRGPEAPLYEQHRLLLSAGKVALLTTLIVWLGGLFVGSFLAEYTRLDNQSEQFKRGLSIAVALSAAAAYWIQKQRIRGRLP